LSCATFTAVYHCCSVSSCGDANKNHYVVVDNFFCTQRNTNNCDWYVLNTSGLIFREDDEKHLATFINPWQVLCCVTELILSVENLRKWHDFIATNSFPAKAMHPLRVNRICSLQWRTQEFCSGGGGFNKFSWGQRERGCGGGSPLVRGSGGSCNLLQEISFLMVTFS
jgi:hypothetical protein